MDEGKREKVGTFSKSRRGVVIEMNCCKERGDAFFLVAPLSIATVTAAAI